MLPPETHFAILLERETPSKEVVRLIQKRIPGLQHSWFSPARIQSLLDEEYRHGHCILTPPGRSFRSLSSGERAIRLLNHVVQDNPENLLLEDPLDNLDQTTRSMISERLHALRSSTRLIYLLHRRADVPSFIKHLYQLREDTFVAVEDQGHEVTKITSLPPPPGRERRGMKELVRFHEVSVAYDGKPVLDKISWKISSGDFWELRGPNGSGKSTLISMITGDNPKAYGKDIVLFGRKKGSGETIWEIKKELGYISPAMTDLFKGYHSCEHMLISGLANSIGLYRIPSPEEKRLAREWLEVIGMEKEAKTYFHQLDSAKQRLLLCARAMIKQPALLLLDEPTTGLDDAGAAMVVSLVNRLAADPERAVVFVSHRKEPGLLARSVLELVPGPKGSIGSVTS